MRPTHIEGMGALGCLTAVELERRGIDFTWNDTGSGHVAWKASTGLIYPAPDPRSRDDLNTWSLWCAEHRCGEHLTAALFAYGHKSPPHGARYTSYPITPSLTVASPVCYVLNVAAFVYETRERLLSRRDRCEDPDATVIVAHGGDRIDHYTWGWSRPVRLALPLPLDLDECRRVAVYGVVDRRMTYAYPIPTRRGWYKAGSTVIAQRTPRMLDEDMFAARWLRDFSGKFPDISVLDLEPVTHGWRPVPAAHDDALPVLRASSGQRRIQYPALGGSGIRWAPGVVESTMHMLTIEGSPS